MSLPFTAENLLLHLLPMASKWQALGESLSLDEDHLDEIFTNNETDEACLQEMLKLYMMRSDLDHNWEEIDTTMRQVKEVTTQSSCSNGSGSSVVESKGIIVVHMVPWFV